MEQSINPSRVHVNSMSVGQSSGVGVSSFYYDGSREREVTMEVRVMMIEGMLGNKTKVNIHWAHSLMKLVSHIAHKMKTMALKGLASTLKL